MKQDNFSFSPKEAKLYGCEEAIMIHHFRWWIQKNIANETNYREKRTWTYNSKKAFIKIFSFWSEKQLRRILDSLVEQKIIMKGNFNKTTFDKTTWYAFVDENLMLGTDFTEYRPNGQDDIAQMGNLLGPNGQMDSPEKSSPLAQTDIPIPDILPYKETDIKKNQKEKKIYLRPGVIVENWDSFFTSEEEKNQYAYAIDFFVNDHDLFYTQPLFESFKAPETLKKYLGSDPNYQGITLKFLPRESLLPWSKADLEKYLSTAPECKLYRNYYSMVGMVRDIVQRRELEEAEKAERNAEENEFGEGPLDHER